MSRDPALSVVIPAFNKAAVLLQTLQALARQTLDPQAFEVIVVDDGSTDGTPQVVASLDWPYAFRLARQDRRGAGAARNLGASLASKSLLLFLDADIILDPGALAAHLDLFAQHGQTVVVSRILPLQPNPVGLEDLLFQESFDLGEMERIVPWHRAITQAMSLPKADFHRVQGFVSDLRRCQDIEFGYRAVQRGLQLLYTPRAVGRHNHACSLARRCQIERRNHEHFVAFARQYPHLAAQIDYLQYKWPPDWGGDNLRLVLRKAARRTLAVSPVLGALEALWELARDSRLALSRKRVLYWSIVGSYQLLGLRDGLRRYGPASLAPPARGDA